MTRLKWVIAIAAAALAAAWGLAPIKAVTVRLPREQGLLIAARKAREGDRLTLSYRHSVEKTMVQGVFGVGPETGLLALETRMESTGTGLPNVAQGRSRREGSWRVVDEQGRPIPGFRFFYLPLNETRLILAGTDLDLGRAGPGSVLFIDAEQTRQWRWVAWRWTGISWPQPESRTDPG